MAHFCSLKLVQSAIQERKAICWCWGRMFPSSSICQAFPFNEYSLLILCLFTSLSSVSDRWSPTPKEQDCTNGESVLYIGTAPLPVHDRKNHDCTRNEIQTKWNQELS